jgi:hypothetical protein
MPQCVFTARFKQNALSRLLRHYSLDSRAMAGNGLVLHQLSRVLVNDKGMRRQVKFKLKTGRQSDIAADFQVGHWVEIRMRDYGWPVGKAVKEAMEVFGYEEPSAVFKVMKRVKNQYVSGKILSDSAEGEWVHYCVPMEYDTQRHCSTVLGWNDPRGCDDDGEPLLIDGQPRDDEAAAILEEREGALMWPERFGPAEIAALKSSLGPYMSSGRLQQSP